MYEPTKHKDSGRERLFVSKSEDSHLFLMLPWHSGFLKADLSFSLETFAFDKALSFGGNCFERCNRFLYRLRILGSINH
jgi:hypothetical protein